MRILRYLDFRSFFVAYCHRLSSHHAPTLSLILRLLPLCFSCVLSPVLLSSIVGLGPVEF